MRELSDLIYTTNVGMHMLMHDIPRFFYSLPGSIVFNIQSDVENWIIIGRPIHVPCKIGQYQTHSEHHDLQGIKELLFITG